MRKHAHKTSPDWTSQPALSDEPPPGEPEVKAVAGERSELLIRKHSGQRLSPNEREQLEALTVRLRELLPPISIGELEALLEMTEDVERIRERARVRRGRLALS